MVSRYDPDIHHRRSLRLEGYDYAQAGAYFVTICAHNRECLFGNVVDGNMDLNALGRMVKAVWDELPRHYQGVALDAFVIMPNHIHGIMVLTPVGARFIAPNNAPNIAPNHAARRQGKHRGAMNHKQGAKQGAMNRAPTVGEIVRGFKARCTHVINKNRQTPGAPVWQRNYYEHIIRNEADYIRIAEYIADNPRRWAEDSLHPHNTIVGARFIAPNIEPNHDRNVRGSRDE